MEHDPLYINYLSRLDDDLAQTLWLLHVIAFAAMLNALLSVCVFIYTRDRQEPPGGAATVAPVA